MRTNECKARQLESLEAEGPEELELELLQGAAVGKGEPGRVGEGLALLTDGLGGPWERASDSGYCKVRRHVWSRCPEVDMGVGDVKAISSPGWMTGGCGGGDQT